MKFKCPHCGKRIDPASMMGKVGGAVKSAAKTRACRINGKKGAAKSREMWASWKKAQSLPQTPK